MKVECMTGSWGLWWFTPDISRFDESVDCTIGGDLSVSPFGRWSVGDEVCVVLCDRNHGVSLACLGLLHRVGLVGKGGSCGLS